MLSGKWVKYLWSTLTLLLAAGLLLPAVLEAVYDAAQPDVEQPDLSVQVVDFLLQRARPASSTPVRSNGSCHEVDSHDEAQRQHGSLWVALELLQDVEAGQGEKYDPRQPEEASKNCMEQIKHSSQEHG